MDALITHPSWHNPAPIYANLVEVEGGHALVWSR
jgi:hypothetical protein